MKTKLKRIWGSGIGKIGIVLFVLAIIGIRAEGSIAVLILSVVLMVLGYSKYMKKHKDDYEFMEFEEAQTPNSSSSSIMYSETDTNGANMDQPSEPILSNKGFVIPHPELRPIANPKIRMTTGEKCYYQGPAQSCHIKNVVIGRQSSRNGVSGSIFKGVSLHSGNTYSENVRGNVSETYDGIFYITNKRIVMNAPRYGFDLPFSKITAVNTDPKSGYFGFMSGGKSYSIISQKVDDIVYVMSHLEINENYDEVNTNYQTELKQLKGLLDQGVITQDDYDSKKKQLLGL